MEDFLFCLPKVFDLINGDQTPWENDPLLNLTKNNELMAYRHEGFWQPMDTLRDKNYLEDLWIRGMLMADLEMISRLPNKKFWKNKKVLITGHSGFKGSWLVIWLHRLGAKVSGISLPPSTSPNLYSLAQIKNIQLQIY